MDDCKIVTDLLPTYCDELTSRETNTFIRTHLNSCPGCSRLLEQMQHRREQQKEADIRRAEFKAALAGYERKHKMRVGLLMLTCVLLIAVFFVFRGCSFDLAIAQTDLLRDQLQVVQEPITDDEGRVFQIVFSQTKAGDAALAYMTKNALGFWTVDAVEIATPDKPYGAAQIVWSEFLFSIYDAEPNITTVFHEVYAGCNATGSFERIPQEQIPGNVTVLATQYSSNYYIHVITVLPDGGSAFDILSLLKENNLIA